MINYRNVLIFVVLVLILLLVGCTKTDVVYGDYYIHGQDDQYYFPRHTTTLPAMAESEAGFYFFSGHNDSYLYYLDKDSMKTELVCAKPECLHEKETNPEKILDCDAAFVSMSNNLIYYGKYLYVIEDKFMTEGSHVHELIQVSLDGTRRKSIYRFDNIPSRVIIHRGYLYYTIDDASIQNDESKSESFTRLYRIALNNLKNEPELLNKTQGIYNRTFHLKGFGNAVYYVNSSYTDLEMTESHYELFRYDIINKDIKVVMNDVANYVFFDNRIAYLNANNLKVYTANLDGSNIKLFGNMYGYMYDDNDYLYVDNFLKTFNKQYHIDDKTPLRQIEVYNANGKMVNSIDIPNVSLLYMFGGNSDYFFLSDEYELDSDEYGPRKALWVIDKRSIKDQDITPKKVFEFIPENQFPGFVLTE